jgi:hypothetical protein
MIGFSKIPPGLTGSIRPNIWVIATASSIAAGLAQS